MTLSTTTATTIADTAIVERRDPVVAPGHDPVVVAFSSQDTTTVDRLRECQAGFARLYAELRWLEEHPGDVDDLVEAGRAVSRRGRALKRLVDLELREHRLGGQHPEIDLHAPLVRQVVALLVDTTSDIANEMIANRDADEVVRSSGSPSRPTTRSHGRDSSRP